MRIIFLLSITFNQNNSASIEYSCKNIYILFQVLSKISIDWLEMIKKILAFNLDREIIFKKIYKEALDDSKIIKEVLSNHDNNFIDLKETIIYKRFDTIYLCFVVEDENEMYIMNLLVFMMSLMDRLLGQINEKSFIYSFKDVDYLIDNFILDGKIINIDPLEISTSAYILE